MRRIERDQPLQKLKSDSDKYPETHPHLEPEHATPKPAPNRTKFGRIPI